MNKPFHQLFIIHFLGFIIGVLVIAGYYDVFYQTFVLFDFTLACWATIFVWVCYIFYTWAFKDPQKPKSERMGSLQRKLLLLGILLSFWLPATLNYIDGDSPGKNESKFLLTTHKR